MLAMFMSFQSPDPLSCIDCDQLKDTACTTGIFVNNFADTYWQIAYLYAVLIGGGGGNWNRMPGMNTHRYF